MPQSPATKVYYRKRTVGPKYAPYVVFSIYEQVGESRNYGVDEFLFTTGTDEHEAYQAVQRMNKER